MKFHNKTLILFLGLSLGNVIFPIFTSAQEKHNMTLEEIYLDHKYDVKTVPGFDGLNDGNHYAKIEPAEMGQSINVYDIVSGEKTATIFNTGNNFEKLGNIEKYQLSKDGSKILLFTNPKPIYRRSTQYNVWLFDQQTKKLTAVNQALVLHASFNPQGNQIAFVKDNNLFIFDIATGATLAITRDGVKNKIINGNCDWVYEEEFEFTQAYQWSPDGNSIAYYRFDESRVKEFTIPFYEEENYPENYTYKYPKAGEDNSIIEIHNFNIATKKDLKYDIGKETNIYIPRIKWASTDNRLCIFRMNRHQNKLEFLLGSPEDGSTQNIFADESDKYVEVNDNFFFVNGKKQIVLTSERDGFNHIYLWDYAEKRLTQLTKGSFDIKSVIGLDEQNENVFYTAGVKTPMEQKLYSVNIKSQKNKCLTAENGFHSIEAINGNRFFLDNYSTTNTPPIINLIDAKGKIVKTLEDNFELKTELAVTNVSPVTFIKVPLNTGTLNGWMIQPPQFDAKKKYPVLMFQYSGPGNQQVLDQYPINNYLWHQYMAEQGFIIICVDGRGTGGRGQEWKKQTYLQLGKLESEDQIATAKYLQTLPYVDGNRIGIWGWSFGGFISSTCIFKGADVFKAAVSVAPVTNWRLYDNVYTERYMRTPQENPSGYDENAPEKMTALLKGHFLNIHGTADDNVHFQNSVNMVKNLVENKKQFEAEYYPNKNHSISGKATRYQLFTRITKFILQNI